MKRALLPAKPEGRQRKIEREIIVRSISAQAIARIRGSSPPLHHRTVEEEAADLIEKASRAHHGSRGPSRRRRPHRRDDCPREWSKATARRSSARRATSGSRRRRQRRCQMVRRGSLARPKRGKCWRASVRAYCARHHPHRSRKRPPPQGDGRDGDAGAGVERLRRSSRLLFPFRSTPSRGCSPLSTLALEPEPSFP